MAAILLVVALAPAAWAEGGRVTLGPNRPESVVDAERLIGDQPNRYEITIAGPDDGSGDGMLFLELRPNQATMHPHMTLINDNGGAVGEDFADDDGLVIRMNVPIGPGRYMLAIDDSHRVTRTAPYRLTTRFTPASDRFEPNDTPALAKPLVAGENAQITLFRYTRGDQDWFSYQHPGGRLSVVSTIASLISPQVHVYNRDNEEVGAGFVTNPGAALRYA
ncbi:MAG: hypothetical protein H7338_16125, partial [Candidatus Sericytochromatia bacterium]|nr:hypothetical protein [Candidatus Sericytochromatia bacterium]